MSYLQKYFKYKKKYLNLVKQLKGGTKSGNILSDLEEPDKHLPKFQTGDIVTFINKDQFIINNVVLYGEQYGLLYNDSNLFPVYGIIRHEGIGRRDPYDNHTNSHSNLYGVEWIYTLSIDRPIYSYAIEESVLKKVKDNCVDTLTVSDIVFKRFDIVSLKNKELLQLLKLKDEEIKKCYYDKSQFSFDEKNLYPMYGIVIDDLNLYKSGFYKIEWKYYVDYISNVFTEENKHDLIIAKCDIISSTVSDDFAE